jgi:hypothetical protein
MLSTTKNGPEANYLESQSFDLWQTEADLTETTLPADGSNMQGESSPPQASQDSPQWIEPLYDWLDPAMLPRSSRSSDNGSYWNGEEDPMTSMASIALDMASIEDLLTLPDSAAAPDRVVREPTALESCFTSALPLLAPQVTFMGSPLDRLTGREDRYLFYHYSNVVARSLCVASPQEGNPFLRLMLPLATTNTAVMGAVLALSACHLQHNGGSSEFVSVGLSHQTQGI